MSSIIVPIIHIRQGDGLNIAYACDNNFVDVMCVSLMSFNDHNCDATIYVLDCGIEEYNRDKILELCSNKNAVFFVDAKKKLDELDYDLNLDRGSVAAYARLFIGSILPNELDKVLYLDCDTLITDSLYSLYRTELDDFILGGVRDAFSYLNKKVFGLKKGDLFINSGILLINLLRYRKDKVETSIIELLKKQESIFQGDQGIINTVVHDRIKELPLRYNVQTYLYDFTYEEMIMYRKPDNYFKKEEVEKAVKNPGIVHFSTCFRSNRPWNIDGNLCHPYYIEWNRYFESIGGEKRFAHKKSFIQKSNKSLFFIGVVHAYVRPLQHMVRK